MDKAKLEFTKKEVEALGGLKSFKSGDWLLKLVQNSFREALNRYLDFG